MFPYMFVCGIVAFSTLLAITRNKSNGMLMVLYAVLTLFSGLRGTFTQDHLSYNNYFTYIDTNFGMTEIFQRSFSMEKGYVILNKLIGYFTNSTGVFTLVISAVTLLIIFLFFNKASLMPVLTVLLYTSLGAYFMAFNMMRQALAVVVLVYATKYISGRKKEWVKYALFAVIALSLHMTAAVFILLTPVLLQRVSFKNLLFVFCVSFVIWVILPGLVNLGMSYIRRYGGYLYGLGVGSMNSVIPILGIFVFFIYSFSAADCNFDCNSDENRLLINASVLHLILLLFGIRVYIVGRYAHYFTPFLYVLVSNVLAHYRNHRERLIITLVIILFSLVFVYITLVNTGYNPYSMFFSR